MEGISGSTETLQSECIYPRKPKSKVSHVLRDSFIKDMKAERKTKYTQDRAAGGLLSRTLFEVTCSERNQLEVYSNISHLQVRDDETKPANKQINTQTYKPIRWMSSYN